MADSHQSASVTASQVRFLRRGLPRAGTARRGPRQHGLPGLHYQRRPRAAEHPVPERARQQLRAGGDLDPVRRRRCGPPLPGSPRHHRQGRENTGALDNRLRARARSPTRFCGHGARRGGDCQGRTAGLICFPCALRACSMVFPSSVSAANGSALKPRRSRGWIWFFVVLGALTVTAIVVQVWFNVQQQLTPEMLAEARAKWKKKGPKDYDLEYLLGRVG